MARWSRIRLFLNRFLNTPPTRWVCCRAASQRLGYTAKGHGTLLAHFRSQGCYVMPRLMWMQFMEAKGASIGLIYNAFFIAGPGMWL